MRRLPMLVTALTTGAAMAAALWIFIPRETPAQVQKQPPPAKEIKAAVQGPALPISQVVLFSSGVGYFQREGEVAGNATLDLSFPVRDINDLLKSLVLQDLGGGQVKAVGYDSFDPMDKTLKSFALDLTHNPTFAELIQQARGEQIEVDWQAQALKGSIVGVERQKQPMGKDQFVEVDMLTILSDTGLRSLPLNQVQRVRLLNPHLDAELKRALEVLAHGHDTHKRTVSLGFTGQGKRQVKVAYVIENPIWKTSYRLVLDKNDKPLLQGWAIVDNVSDEDWKNVQVTLVSGRPISFQMNLYQPLYVPRPWQELEMFAGLRPQVYGGDMAKDGKAGEPKEGQGKQSKQIVDEDERVTDKGKKREQRMELEKLVRPLGEGWGGKPGDNKSTMPDVAGAEVGEFFQYAIKQPVSLARQRSSMLPIVNQPIEAKRLSVYNAAVQVKHPLLGLKLKNTTDAHLMQGPITVFEGASYAGDARILDLQPKEERLLTYAIDQGVEVEPVAKNEPQVLVNIQVVKGILHATYKVQETKTYNVKNRSTHSRDVLIEHPFRPDWKLLNDKEPAERSRDVYRFLVSVPPGQSATQTVSEELSRLDQVSLTTSNDDAIRYYLTSPAASAKIKEALTKAVGYRVKLADTQREMSVVDKQIKAVAEDQVRIRANMERVPQNSAPYQRYLKKLDEQETQIESLQDQVKTLRRREEDQRREYESFLIALTVKE